MSGAVTVAVVSWNTRDLLDACLRSLASDARTGVVDVWVHDNASTDGSPQMVAERHGWAHLVRCAGNLGFGTAVNRVAELTDGAWIVAANADLRVAPGALSTLVAAGEADPGAGLVAPRLILPDGTTQPSLHAFQTLGRSWRTLVQVHRLGGRRAACELFPSFDLDRARRVPWAAGALVLLRRSAFAAVGGFDERQWMYAEDLDLCWRLRQAGWATRYEPAAVVHHEESAAADQAFGDDVRLRQAAASWSWTVRRQGLAAAWGVALLGLLEGAGRYAGTVALRRDPGRRRDAAWQMRWALTGLRSRRALLAAR